MQEIHSDEWFERRRKTLGASEIAAVLGLSKWQTPFDVWSSKINGDKTEMSQAAYLGHLLQPIIAEEAARIAKVKINETELYKQHKKETWASATCDYICEDDDGELSILEIKATRDLSWREIPIQYRMQTAWQSFVTGIPVGRIAVLHASTSLKIYDFPDSSEWFQEVFDLCRKFWFEHVVANIPPEVPKIPKKTLNSIKAISGQTVDLDMITQQNLTELHAVRSRIKELNEIKDELENQIKYSLNNSEIGLIDGKIAVTWKETNTTRFDSSALKAADPKIYKKFLKTSKIRTFLVKDITPKNTKKRKSV